MVTERTDDISPARRRNAIIAFCAISAIVGLTLNLMPVSLGSAADHFSLALGQIGALGSSLLWGLVIGSSLFFALHSRFNWQWLTASSLMATSLLFLLSQFAPNIPLLFICWAAAGVCAGIPFSAAFMGLTRLGDPERMIGLKLMCEVLVGAIFLYFVSAYIVPRWHYAGVATLIGVAFFLAVIAVRYIPKYIHGSHIEQVTTKVSFKDNLPAWGALITFSIYFSGQIGLWAFLERIGHGAGVPLGEIGLILAITKLVGAATAGAIVVIGTRYGMRWPYLAGPVCILIGVGLIYNIDGVYGYALGCWVWDIGFELTGCYQMAAVTRLDKSGKLAALVPAAAGMGAAIGPITSGFLAESGGFLAVFTLSGSCAIFSGVVYYLLMSSRRMKIQPATP